MGKLSKSVGNKFQEDFFNSIPKDLYADRYKDAPVKFKHVDNPADYWINAGDYVLLVECKSTKDTSSIPLSNFRMGQVWKMFIACTKKRTYGGFLINFRNRDKTYFVFIGEFINWYLHRTSQSLPYSWIVEHGYKVSQMQRISRWRYGIQGLLNWIREVNFYEA